MSVKRYNKDVAESMIKKRLIMIIDQMFEDNSENEFENFINSNNNVTDKQAKEIESIFMAFRNVIAGTEWAGEIMKYKKYEVRGQ